MIRQNVGVAGIMYTAFLRPMQWREMLLLVGSQVNARQTMDLCSFVLSTRIISIL